jgi:RNA polymerase sigma-70 factor (ECF subfamily)
VHQPDVEAVQRVLAGDTEAFGVLVRQYQQEIYRLTYRMTRNAEDAKDLAQEAFVQAYRALAAFRGQSRFSTWLYRIAMNLCLNHLKVAAREDPAALDASLADTRTDVLDALLTDERDRAVVAAIRTLPPQQRATLVLRVQQGLGHREVAEILGCAEGTAKANYFHAVRALQRKLQAFREGASDHEQVR